MGFRAQVATTNKLKVNRAETMPIVRAVRKLILELGVVSMSDLYGVNYGSFTETDDGVSYGTIQKR